MLDARSIRQAEVDGVCMINGKAHSDALTLFHWMLGVER